MAPIPPVLGPASPSSSRLWSRAGGSMEKRSPSQKASIDISVPVRRSSSRISSPADPNRRSTSIDLIASAASSSVAGTITPLPAANPEALTTGGSGRESRCANAESGLWNTRASAVGIRLAVRNRLQYDLEDSSRAQVAVGPKAAIPADPRASTRPAASASSGPTATKPTDSSRHRRTSPATSSAATGAFSVRSHRSVPALPGATSSRLTWGDRLNAQARACSRPPLPTTRTQLIVHSPHTDANCSLESSRSCTNCSDSNG